MLPEIHMVAAARLGVRRRFLHVDGRQSHYITLGNGPPIILIHASPATAWEMLPTIEYLALRFTCIAFDTPGLGLSDPIATEISLGKLADALATNMKEIGLPPCPIYGRHTGAGIALELAARHPEQVSGIVLDGLSMFTEAECTAMYAGYFTPISADELGGHFSRAWTRFRDHSIWFPWFVRNPGNLNQYDLAPAAKIQNYVTMFFYGEKSYLPIYRAAMAHSQSASDALLSLDRPAVLMALESDMLFSHLERLPVLKPNQEICPVGDSVDIKNHAVAGAAITFSDQQKVSLPLHKVNSSASICRQFVDVRCGETVLQIHVRFAGSRSNPCLLLLHDAPGSALFLSPLIEQLATRFFVCAPDMPGCGESTSLPQGKRDIADFAAAMKALCIELNFVRPLIYGIGFGSSAAVKLAANFSNQFTGVVLRAVLLPSEIERNEMSKRYAPKIAIEEDGSHWYRTWLMLRDTQIYWPWYEHLYTSRRKVSGDFGAEHLHAWTFEIMKQPESYRHIIHAALRHDARQEIVAINVPLVICGDPTVPLSIFDCELEQLLPHATVLDATESTVHADEIFNCFDFGQTPY